MALARDGTVYRSLNRSIAEAVAAGRLDLNANAAGIAAARKVARIMDDPEWPIVENRFDNVSPALLLKYCAALNLLPPPMADQAQAKPRGLALDKMRRTSGAFKVMAG